MNIEMANNQIGNMAQPMAGGVQRPIIEPMQERIVNRTIVHEVPHVCPMRTKIVNHHVFKHTYQPSYSCCEENVCSEVALVVILDKKSKDFFSFGVIIYNIGDYTYG